MKNNIGSQPTKQKDRSSDYELRAIAALNSDLNRTDYPTVSTTPAVLAQVVASAMQGRNPFQFCHDVAKLARKIHNSQAACIQTTITQAMQMMIQPIKRPAVRAINSGVAA